MEEEISMRELIDILISGKKIIALTTILAIFFIIIINCFILEPVYEAKVILMAPSLSNNVKPEDIKELKSLINSISLYPQFSIDTYKEQIKSSEILTKVIKELDLTRYNISRERLSDMITLDAIDKTNLITIKVKYNDPKLVSDIANSVAKKFVDYITIIANEQSKKSLDYLKKQVDSSKEKLGEALLEYKSYLSQPKNISEIEKEVELKTLLITQYKGDLLNAEIQEKMLEASLETAYQVLANTNDKIILKNNFINDPIMLDYIEHQINESVNVSVQTEEVNEAYTYLLNQINDIKIQLSKIKAQKKETVKAIEKIHKELEVLNAELAEKQYKKEILLQNVDFNQSTYKAFFTKYEESKILQLSGIGEYNIAIVSPAVQPAKPVGSNIKLNIAIAGVLGFLIGMFFVLIKYYWQKAGTIPPKIS